MSATLAGAQTVDPSLYSGLVWRNVGPFRGGRVAAVSGAIGQPGVFYMGLPLGGVWKTTNAGVTWAPIMDSVKDASSVGAVEVAPSDPNVIYVGMGDMVTGGGINEGNGVFKSTDGGKTWQHLGLEDTKQIPSIIVDPHDPNIVLVAGQGNLHQESESRGVFRSTDGGKTWTKTLYLDKQTGAQKLAYAFDHPETILCTTDRHYFAAGAARAPRGAAETSTPGSAGTRLYKSTDGGVTWKQLTGGGLPSLSGRTCVAVANGTNAQRMFLVQNSGLWRSDDGGDHWKKMDDSDKRVANGQGGYNCGVYVNPKNPDTVYVVNTCSYISHDGGNTFTGFKGAPGGDDPQQFWFDPTDGNRIFLGSDQGATISLDGGATWGSWYNQPTAQVYHICVDNQFPYWIYATQQDSGSIGTASRGNYGEITPFDWTVHPGYEFGSIVADPLNPKITYAGGDTSGISKVTFPSGQWINVSPNMDSKAGLRHVGNQPLAFSPTNPHELLAGFQFLMSTTDGGMHWKKLGGDLAAPKAAPAPPKDEKSPAKPTSEKAAPEKPKTGSIADPDEDDDDDMDEGGQASNGEWMDRDAVEQRGGGGGAIESFSPSSVDGGVIWVGTNNGMIKVTRDHGKTWDDVTIPNLENPTRADISAIDASHHDPGTAYAAIDYHGAADYKPYLYRTRDFGKTWTKIVNGLPTDLPSGSFTRVIRADTKRKGLLFAGTESYVYVSFDDGDNWQSLALNQPNTSYRDMVVKDNDLVVGTYGRSFWILDDISPLREVTPAIAGEAAHLFKPGDAIRVRRNVNDDTPFPPEVPHALNPPASSIYYYLGAQPSGRVTLEISDASGKVVRHMSSDPIPALNEPAPPIPDFWVETPTPLSAQKGMFRVEWNLRMDSPPAFSHSYEINATPGLTPASPEGPLVTPGTYKVVLKVDGKSYEQSLTVKNDPRSPASDRDVKKQGDLLAALYDGAQTSYACYRFASSLKDQVEAVLKANPSGPIADAAKDFEDKITAIEGNPTAARRFGGFGGGGGGGSDFVRLTGAFDRQMMQLDFGDMAPNEAMIAVFENLQKDLKTVQANWKALLEKDLPAFNTVLNENGAKPIGS